MRVLVADDSPQFVDMLVALLSREERIDVVGYARDGLQAVDLARTLEPDVILMDISMPAMDGIEATRLIRAQPTRSRVLVLSGSNSRIDVDRARDAGAAAYLTKDRIASELVDAIVDVAGRELS